MRKLERATFVWGLFALGLGCGLGVQAARHNAGAQERPRDRLWLERDGGAAAVAIPSLADLVARVAPAVANIHRAGGLGPEREAFERIFGRLPQHLLDAPLGTAFVINRDGLLLTNHHVVEQGEVRVKLADGTYHAVEVVGLDRETDVALLRVRAGRALPTVPLGDSDALAIGDWVVAIGNPLGLEHTVTAGIVGAKERHDINPSDREAQYTGFIQTDAAINPGNSGGPLFNLAGEVIGINAAVNAAGQGLGFAIPINTVKRLVPSLNEHGFVRRSFLGIVIQPLTAELAQSFGIESTEGALVNEVVPDTPAARVGLRIGDVVVSLDGQAIRDAGTLPLVASTVGVAREVEIAVLREGRRQSLRVRLDELPGQTPFRRSPPRQVPPTGDTGMLVRDLTPPERRQIGRSGVMVTALDDASAAAQADVQRHDVIVMVDGEPTPDAQTFLRQVNAVPRGRIVRLLVVRPTPRGGLAQTYVAYRR
jgi:Do/DeqQ family serine protease